MWWVLQSYAFSLWEQGFSVVPVSPFHLATRAPILAFCLCVGLLLFFRFCFLFLVGCLVSRSFGIIALPLWQGHELDRLQRKKNCWILLVLVLKISRPFKLWFCLCGLAFYVIVSLSPLSPVQSLHPKTVIDPFNASTQFLCATFFFVSPISGQGLHPQTLLAYRMHHEVCFYDQMQCSYGHSFYLTVRVPYRITSFPQGFSSGLSTPKLALELLLFLSCCCMCLLIRLLYFYKTFVMWWPLTHAVIGILTSLTDGRSAARPGLTQAASNKKWRFTLQLLWI